MEFFSQKQNDGGGAMASMSVEEVNLLPTLENDPLTSEALVAQYLYGS
jgi:hypothetical protein